MKEELIFWPMIILALATFGLYTVMSSVRIRGVKSGKVDPKVYKLNNNEPDDSRLFSNAIKNQFESPVLFYTVCISAYVTGMAGTVMILLAFAYALAKIAHMWLHVSKNRITRRLLAFMVSFVILVSMWVFFAIQLLIS